MTEEQKTALREAIAAGKLREGLAGGWEYQLQPRPLGWFATAGEVTELLDEWKASGEIEVAENGAVKLVEVSRG